MCSRRRASNSARVKPSRSISQIAGSAPGFVVGGGGQQGVLLGGEEGHGRAQWDSVWIVTLGRIAAEHSGIVDQKPEKSAGGGEAAFARGPAVGIAQQPGDVRLSDGSIGLGPISFSSTTRS